MKGKKKSVKKRTKKVTKKKTKPKKVKALPKKKKLIQRKRDCRYCVGDNEDMCLQFIDTDDGRFYCSRKKGHGGEHVACGVDNRHVLIKWVR